jgi:hypothetical protein
MDHSPGWAAQINGDQIDLDDLQDLLSKPFDPWVEIYRAQEPAQVLLRSRQWDPLENAREVSEQAARLVERLNGSLPIIFEDAKPVTLGIIVKFDADGNRHMFAIHGTGFFVRSGARCRFRGLASGAIPVTSRPSMLQHWSAAADSNEFRSELLVHLGRLIPRSEVGPEINAWFDVYKAAELIRKLGGGHTLPRSIAGADQAVWEQVWGTANYYRHAPGLTNALPQPPADLDAARALLLRLAPKVL